MARTFKDSPQSKQNRDRSGRGRKRNISVRSVQRDEPDVRRLSQAVIALAMAEAEAEAQAEPMQPTTEPDSSDGLAEGVADDR